MGETLFILSFFKLTHNSLDNGWKQKTLKVKLERRSKDHLGITLEICPLGLKVR